MRREIIFKKLLDVLPASVIVATDSDAVNDNDNDNNNDNTMNTLSNIEAVALAKSVRGKADEIIPGSYSGKFTVEIDYSLVKGSDYDVAPTCNLLSKAVIAKALSIMGFQADNFLAALEKAALETLVNGGEVADAVLNPAVEAKLAELEARVIAKLPRAARSGATKVKATAKVVEADVDDDEVVVLSAIAA